MSDGADGAFNSAAGATAETAEALPRAQRPAHKLPESIGPYRVLECIGEGGMGVVYKAEQRQPVRRIVALKVIKLGMDTKEVVARFEAERQALAMLSHPNVAKVFEAGATEEGRPYFAMEHVPGVPLNQYCDENKLTTRERLDLFIPVCHAVQHAHQKGIIHRDLKPSNILVCMFDGKPVPKVIDFGIAKASNAALTQKTLFTQTGALVGTPEYMSPEQAMTSGLDVDTRTDVYSLGVILYELLTGVLPFDPEELRRAGAEGMARMIKETEPGKPSTRLSVVQKPSSGNIDPEQIARRHSSDARSLQREIKGDLDWIVLKAMEKDRTRRYETVNGLALDVQRYLNDELVSARPPSTWYRATKLVRKHKVGVVAAAAVALALIAGLAGTTYGLVRARQERDHSRTAQLAAERAREATAAANQFMGDLFASFVRAPAEAQRRLGAAAQKLDEGWLADQPRIASACRIMIAYGYLSTSLPAEAQKQFEAALKMAQGPDGQYVPESAGSIFQGIGAVNLSRRDFAAAERYLSQAVAQYRRRSNSDAQAAYALEYLAIAQDAQGKNVAARATRLEMLAANVAALTAQMEPRPADPALLFSRAAFRIRLGHFREAEADLARVTVLDPSDHAGWYHLACLRMYEGDEAGYRQAAGEMFNRFSTTERREFADRTAKTCLLSPSPVGGIEAVGRMVDRAVAGDSDHESLPWFHMCKGLERYRAGQFREARQWLDKASGVGGPFPQVTRDMLIAMTDYRLGNSDGAVERYRAVIQRIETRLPQPGKADLIEPVDFMICQVIRREADKMFAVPPAATRPDH